MWLYKLSSQNWLDLYINEWWTMPCNHSSSPHDEHSSALRRIIPQQLIPKTHNFKHFLIFEDYLHLGTPAINSSHLLHGPSRRSSCFWYYCWRRRYGNSSREIRDNRVEYSELKLLPLLTLSTHLSTKKKTLSTHCLYTTQFTIKL